MGRLAKNNKVAEVFAEAVTLPSGSILTRPNNPVTGTIRFNITSSKLEFWNGTEWKIISSEGYIPIDMDTFTGNGTDAVFGPCSRVFNAGQEKDVLVFIDSVYQIPYESYVFVGTSFIIFSSIPPLGSTIVILSGFNSTITQ